MVKNTNATTTNTLSKDIDNEIVWLLLADNVNNVKEIIIVKRKSAKVNKEENKSCSSDFLLLLIPNETTNAARPAAKRMIAIPEE